MGPEGESIPGKGADQETRVGRAVGSFVFLFLFSPVRSGSQLWG